MKKATTYKDSGVDIAAGEELVDRIKPIVRRTFTEGVLSDIGAFGGFFRPDFRGMSEPVLVSSVDGVGTKLKIAFAMNVHDTVGQDLVNHCVNDIAVCGAQPLFFLDYFSTGKLDVNVGEQVISGFAKACEENGCALIGGETAEMPDIYSDGEYDLAGMVVGVVDKQAIIDGSGIRAGDMLLGFPSSGLHTNGYSLARKVLLSQYSLHDAPDELGGVTLGRALLEVHLSYLPIVKLLRNNAGLTGMAHITGGGIPGNVSRIIPDGLRAVIDYDSWIRPGIFDLIQRAGSVDEPEMRSALNLGIGLVIVVRESAAGKIISILQSAGEKPVIMGNIQKLRN